MKKQYFFLMAAATLTFVGCSNDSIVDDPVSPPPVAEQEVPISFGSFRAQTTRADKTGAEAAALLGNQFVVSGYKGDKTSPVGNIVFDNYVVKYIENTAHTTQSNSTNWEYVGQERIKHAIDRGITSQTIKYWDYSKAQYDFIAWSTGIKTPVYVESELADGKVFVSAITPVAATSPATGLGAAYTFTGKAADLSQCYIADLVTVKKAQYARSNNEYPVTFKFRQLGTKVRIGIYETVPGYSVKDVKFYSAAASNDAQATYAKLFTTTANEIFTEGVYTVTFPTVDADGTDADNNQAHVTFAPKAGTSQSTVVNWGGLNYTIAEEGEKTAGNVFLGRSSSTASYAGNADDNYYVVYLPNEIGTNLNLRVNYTLESIDGSGEVITVKGATAQVPGIYTQWKPGFAYTYLFKISDKTNGHTGVYDPTKPDDTTVNSDPAGLYPITFDAVVVNAEDNDKTQETITLVSTPSITTYQKGSTVVNADEYQASKGNIFVTVNDGNTESTPDLANGKLQTLTGKAALYTIPAGKTEAEVVDALQMQDDDAATGTIKGRSGLVLTEATSSLVNKVEFGVDGNAIPVGTDQALRFTPAAGTYAFVYTKKAAVPANNVEKYQVVTKAAGVDVTGLYRNRVEAPAGDVQAGKAYFKNHAENFAATTVFVGQGVGNLFTDNTGTHATTQYAVTGTTYYYDDGITYSPATNIAYADFAGATDLYTFDGTDYTLKTDATPVNGTAYYQRTGAGTTEDPFVYTYCVILPQQTTGLFVEGYGACANSETAVAGVTYFDKYTKNDGVYYTKIIKVQ